MSNFPVRKINRDFLLKSNSSNSKIQSPNQLDSPKSDTRTVVTTISVEDTRKVVAPKIIQKSPEQPQTTKEPLKCLEPIVSDKDYEDGDKKAISSQKGNGFNNKLNTSTETDNEEELDFKPSEDEDDALSLFAGSDFEDTYEPENTADKMKVTLSSHATEESARNVNVISESSGTSDKLNNIKHSSDQKIVDQNASLPGKNMTNQSGISLQDAIDNEFIAKAILEANVFPEPFVLTNAIVKSLIKMKNKTDYVGSNVNSNDLLNGQNSSLDYNRNSQAEIKKTTISNRLPTVQLSREDKLPNYSKLDSMSSRNRYQKTDHTSIDRQASKTVSSFDDIGLPFIPNEKDLPEISANRRCSLLSTPPEQLIHKQNLIPTDRKRKLDHPNCVDLNMNKPRRFSGGGVKPSNGENRIVATNENVDSFLNGFPKEDTDLRLLFNEKNNANKLQYDVSNNIANPSPPLIKEIQKISPESSGLWSSKYSAPITSSKTFITQSPPENQRRSNPFASCGFRALISTISSSQAPISSPAIQSTSVSHPFLLKSSASENTTSVSSTRTAPISGGFQSELLAPSASSFNYGYSSLTPLAARLPSEVDTELGTTQQCESPLLARSVSNDIDWPGKMDIAAAQGQFKDCVIIARDAFKRTELGTQMKRPFGEKELSNLVHHLAHEYSAFESAVLAGCIETHPSVRVLTTLVNIVENYVVQLMHNEELIKTLFIQFCKVLCKDVPSKHFVTVLDKFVIAFSTLGQWKRMWSVLVQSHVKQISGSTFLIVSEPLLQSDHQCKPEQSWFKTAVRLASTFTEIELEKSQHLAQNIAQLWLRCIDLNLSGFLAILGGFPDKPLLPQVKKQLLDDLDSLVVQCIVACEYEKLISLIQAGSGLLDDLSDIFVKGFSLMGEDTAAAFNNFLNLVSVIHNSNYFHLWCAFLKDIGYVLMKHLSDVYSWQQVQKVFSCITSGVLAICPSCKKFNAQDAHLLNIEADLKLQNFNEAYHHAEDLWLRLDMFSAPSDLSRIMNILKEMLNYYIHVKEDLCKAEHLFWLLIKCLSETNVDSELMGIQTYYNSLVENCAKSLRWNNFAHSIIHKAMSAILPKELKLVLSAYPLRLLIVSSIRVQDADLTSLLTLLDRGQTAHIYERETILPDSTLLYIPTDAATEEIQLILYGLVFNLRKRLVELTNNPTAGSLLDLCRVKISPKDVGQRDPHFLTFTESTSSSEDLIQRIQQAMSQPVLLSAPLQPFIDNGSILLDSMDLYTCVYETFNT